MKYLLLKRHVLAQGEMNKPKAILLLILVLLLVACNAAGEKGYQTGEQLQAAFDIPQFAEGVNASHAKMNYLLYLPEGYGEDPDKEWPLIFFLHGAGDEDNDSGFVMSYGLPEVLYKGEEPDNFPFIVVSPQALPGNSWWSGDMVVLLDALLQDVIDNYQVDPQRLYLTGLSLGGYGSWYLATAYPERFAAVVSISGSGYQIIEIPPAETLCRLKDVPIWAIHGAQDLISDPILNENYIEALRETCDGDVRWTLYPDAGHFETYARAYRDPELYEWLLEH